MKLGIGVFLMLFAMIAQAQVVTDSKLHLLDHTNPKKTPAQWVKYCSAQGEKYEIGTLQRDLAYTKCIDDLILKHRDEITGAECEIIARKIETEKSTRSSYLRKCYDEYGYDLCVARANEFPDPTIKKEERKKCLVKMTALVNPDDCRKQIKENYPDLDPKMCDRTKGPLAPGVTRNRSKSNR